MTDAALHRPARWWVLAAFTLVAGISQMLWLNLAPVLSMIQARYQVDELTASVLILVFPLLYVLFSIPAGSLTDSRGYRFTVGLGAITMAVFAALRIWDASFWILMAGQIGIAAAQPFVVNGTTKLVSDWFSPEHGVIATGLATMGMFLGMAAGMAATPPLVDATGFRMTMVVFAGIATAGAILFGLIVRPNEQARPAPKLHEDGFGPLLRDRRLWTLFGLALFGMGVFNGLTTWLEEILAPQGIDSEQTGLIGGAMIIGGIVGAVVFPLLADKTRRRKPFLILCGTGALVTLYPLCTLHGYSTLLVLGGLHGFFFMPAFALLLDMCSQVAGARSAGAASSLVMLAGNAGAVLVIVTMALIKGNGNDWRPAVILMVALMALATLLGILAPETVPPAEA